MHQSTLQKQHDEDKVKHKLERREHLIKEARKAYQDKLLADKAGGAARECLSAPTLGKEGVESVEAGGNGSLFRLESRDRGCRAVLRGLS